MNDKLAKRELKLINEQNDRANILRFVENPVFELVAGFSICEFLRTINLPGKQTSPVMSDTRTSILGGIYSRETITTGSSNQPLFRPSALNWCEAGILLAVLTQQMKDNPNARALGTAGIGALGELGSSAIGTVGNTLKTGLGLLGGTAMLTGAGV